MQKEIKYKSYEKKLDMRSHEAILGCTLHLQYLKLEEGGGGGIVHDVITLAERLRFVTFRINSGNVLALQ